jgi:hypothetical protein
MNIVKYPAIIAITLLSLAIFNWSYSYYILLRFVVTGTAIYYFVNTLQLKSWFWSWTFIGIGILFNPIFPIYIQNKFIWIVIDISCAILLYIFINKSNKMIRKILNLLALIQGLFIIVVWILGFGLWVWAGNIVLTSFGVGVLMIGLFLGGVGIVPIAMFASGEYLLISIGLIICALVLSAIISGIIGYFENIASNTYRSKYTSDIIVVKNERGKDSAVEVCTACGKKIKSSSNFCKYCGTERD